MKYRVKKYAHNCYRAQKSWLGVFWVNMGIRNSDTLEDAKHMIEANRWERPPRRRKAKVVWKS